MPRKETGKQQGKTGPLKVEASITDLVRTNLIGLLNAKQGGIVVNNAFIDAYEDWESTQKSHGIWVFTRAIPGLNRKRRNVEEWSVARLAIELGVDVGVIRKIFETKRGKGASRLTIDDVVQFALIFDVTPGYLLQPLREHLERDTTYFFETIGPNGYEVKARDWLLWVHGISTADGSNSKSLEENLMSLSPAAGLDINSKRAIFPQDELERIAEAQYVSPVSAMLAAQSSPVPGHLMSGVTLPKEHPMDSIKRGVTFLDRLHVRTRAALAYMQHVRQAIRMVEKEHDVRFVKEDIEWILNRMREDLSQIAVNIEEEKGDNE